MTNKNQVTKVKVQGVEVFINVYGNHIRLTDSIGMDAALDYVSTFLCPKDVHYKSCIYFNGENGDYVKPFDFPEGGVSLRIRIKCMTKQIPPFELEDEYKILAIYPHVPLAHVKKLTSDAEYCFTSQSILVRPDFKINIKI